MPNQTCSLFDATRHLLHRDGRTLLTIHSSSGISFYWLKKFSAGEIKDPSVNTVQRLYEFLSGKKLPL